MMMLTRLTSGFPALRLQERKRKRAEFLAPLDEAEVSLARGEGRVFATKQDVRELAREMNQRGRARPVAESLLQRPR